MNPAIIPKEKTTYPYVQQIKKQKIKEIYIYLK